MRFHLSREAFFIPVTLRRTSTWDQVPDKSRLLLIDYDTRMYTYKQYDDSNFGR